MTTRAEAVAAAGAAYAQALANQAARTPREAAEAAWRPGGPDVDELEARIRAERGLTPKAKRGAA